MLTFPGITPILMTYQGKQGPACGREDILGPYPFISAAAEVRCEGSAYLPRNGRKRYTGVPTEASAMRAKRRQKPLTKQVRALMILQVTHSMRGSAGLRSHGSPCRFAARDSKHPCQSTCGRELVFRTLFHIKRGTEEAWCEGQAFLPRNG